ncbi:hypothetical protein [Borreliella burgdorferi]|uniref:hypothetical protein n=2 Tax=Borreliella burgdorferi TaxID=139 RepID=UPI0039BFA00B
MTGSLIWSRNYCLLFTGDDSIDIVKKYIQKQNKSIYWQIHIHQNFIEIIDGKFFVIFWQII